jgi:hypothetical protein
MRRLIVVGSLWLIALPVFAQSGPELDALMEVINAKDVATLLRHLPPEIGEAAGALPPAEQNAMAADFLVSARLQKEGLKATRPDSGPVLVIERTVGNETKEEAEIYLDRRLTDGEETLLRFRIEPKNGDPMGGGDFSIRDVRFSVGMRYVDDEWRIYDVEGGPAIRLDDPKLIGRIIADRHSSNEATAVGSLRTYNTALVTYSSSFPEIGFPASLTALGGGGGGPDHAGLVDNLLGSPPFQKYGYSFSYRQISKSEYTISARPVADTSGADVARSFFTDQTGVIRSTQEDRDATADDPPLQ